MSDLIKLSCQDFLKKLSSNAPTPGGGGGAAMAGALAAALTSLVGNLTVGKEKFAEQEAEVKEILEDAEALRLKLLNLVTADAEAFNNFMACYKMPRGTDLERYSRAQAIQRAAKQTAEVPLKIAKVCLEVMRYAERIAAIGNPGAITDAAVSAILGRAAMRSALYNVIVNLKIIKDDFYTQDMYRKLEAMEQEAYALEKSTLATADEVLA